MAFDWSIFLNRVFAPSPIFLGALVNTVLIAVLAQVLGTVLGVLLATMGTARSSVLRIVTFVYVWIMRGTPALVQVFFLFYGLPLLLGIDIFPREIDVGPLTVTGAMIAGIVGLGLNEAAYMSEIVRAGIESIDIGQREAALMVGMTPAGAMRRIILPQAARVVVPPLGNQFNGMLKSTSMLAFIGVYEIFLDTQNGYSRTFKPAEYFLAVAVWYLLLTTIWGIIQAVIERRLSNDVRSAPLRGKALQAIELDEAR
jgi:polar amino acid transport system permease protein